VLQDLELDYNERKQAGTFNADADNVRYEQQLFAWANDEVRPTLTAIFPTSLEWNGFRELTQLHMSFTGLDPRYAQTRYRLQGFVTELRNILDGAPNRYTDLPEAVRLYIEDIDSFAAARDVNPQFVAPLLSADGYLDVPEDEVQIGFEQIINKVFHKKDWGGETNDLYSSQVRVNGRRVATAFLLKGNGLRKHTMELRDCGANGDQIVRLFTSPALLYIVQFVGNISESVIKDVEGKVNEQRAHGKPTHYCIMNGQDTARVLISYGKLAIPGGPQ